MGLDTVIIGAGVMGCGVALRLAQAGQRVAVLERSVPGAEASSAAGGILAPQAECDRPGPLLDIALLSRGLYPDLAAELRERTGVDIGFRPCGVLKVAFDEASQPLLTERARWQVAAGLRAEMLGPEDARALEPALSPAIRGALHLPDEGQVDNRQLVIALQIAAARAGAQFRAAGVRRIRVEGGRARGVEIDGEVLEAGAVVLAAGAWSSLVPGAGLWAEAVRPARGQMAQLESRPPALSRIVFCERGYLVPRADGRLLVGSTLELVGFDKRVTAGALRRLLDLAEQVAPRLAEATVADFWAGFRPYTGDGLPLLGPSPVEGLFFATGHHRNGILLAPATAKLVAESVLGRAPSLSLDAFAPRRAFAA